MKQIFFVLLLSLALFFSLVLVACTEPPVTPPPSPLPLPAEGRLDKSEVSLVQEVMTSDLQVLLAAAVFLSLVANRLVEGLVTPIFDKFKLDKFWLMYIAWAICGALTAVSGINLFTAIPGVAMPFGVGLVLSALVSGGGSNLLNELFDWLGQGKSKVSR